MRHYVSFLNGPKVKFTPPPPTFITNDLDLFVLQPLICVAIGPLGHTPTHCLSICCIIVSDVLTSPVNSSIYGFILQKSNTYVNQYNGSVNSRNRLIIKQNLFSDNGFVERDGKTKIPLVDFTIQNLTLAWKSYSLQFESTFLFLAYIL